MSEREYRLEEIPSCFEGIIPATITTVDPDGMPNVTYLSIVHRIDEEHVALSRQFFRKTDENTVRNPLAYVTVSEVESGRLFALELEYERTDTTGPFFERMRVALDAVAAYEGMEGVFNLKGLDVCRVLSCRMVPSEFGEAPPPRQLSIERLQAVSERIARAEDIDDLLQSTLDACVQELGFPHAFMMLVDETGRRLYTVASAGYGASGEGSEVAFGDGFIGRAAERRQSIRITNLARERTYAHASGPEPRAGGRGESVIPLPSLHGVQSLLVTPMLGHRKLIGVLCFESASTGAFQSADECAAGILANQVAMAYMAMQEEARSAPGPAAPVEATERAVQVKHYREDDSVFFDNEYLIKGVAGAILWRLIHEFVDHGRTEFSNKEIRLDASLELPDIKDNLEARLILLRRRLSERSAAVGIEKVARGRFRLVVNRPLQLVNVEGGGPL